MKYFLHVKHLSQLAPDLEGMELASLNEARREAVLAVKGIAAECLLRDTEFTLQSIRVCSDEGNLLDEIFAQDVLQFVFDVNLGRT